MPDETWLLIDTSARRGLVALVLGGTVRSERHLDDARKHARDLTGVVAELVREQGITVRELTGVMVGVGPGSYTGLRVGIVSAKALAFATGCRIVAVPTFQAIARRLNGVVHVIADGQQGKVYCQRFASGVAGALGVRAFGEWLDDINESDIVTGPGVAMDEASLAGRAAIAPIDKRHATGASMFDVGRGLPDSSVETIEPLYLRGSSAEEKANAPR